VIRVNTSTTRAGRRSLNQHPLVDYLGQPRRDCIFGQPTVGALLKSLVRVSSPGAVFARGSGSKREGGGPASVLLVRLHRLAGYIIGLRTRQDVASETQSLPKKCMRCKGYVSFKSDQLKPKMPLSTCVEDCAYGGCLSICEAPATSRPRLSACRGGNASDLLVHSFWRSLRGKAWRRVLRRRCGNRKTRILRDRNLELVCR
jgi:hypothetical protein